MNNNEGLTAEEARVAAELSPLSNYWKRCSELREMGMIKATGEERLGSLRQLQMVSEITPIGKRHALELLTLGHTTFPAYTSAARSTDPGTSHASQHNPQRKTRAASQQGKLLIAFHVEMENRLGGDHELRSDLAS
jgi:hypothetical protein